jgi:hypothetical protein
MVFTIPYKEAPLSQIAVSRILLYFYKNIQNEKSVNRDCRFLFPA